MSHHLMLKAASLYELRQAYFKLKSVQLTSSIFYAQNKYYLIVSSSLPQLITFDYVEQQVYQWGIAQLKDNIEYLQIESMTKLIENGRALFLDGGSLIVRTYYGLSEIMAILNITEDSFSDGDKYNTLEAAIMHSHELYSQGVRLIDVGFESTRPNAHVKSDDEEIALIKKYLPELIKLKNHYPDLRFSIDTYHQASIQYLLKYNIDYINDVSGSLDVALIKQLHMANIKYIAMHSLDIPVIKENIIPLDYDPALYLLDWQLAKIEYYQKHDLDMSKIIFDPGIGFGNNPSQAFSIIRNLDKLHSSLLLGFSRKSLFSYLSTRLPCERDIYTASLACQLDGKVAYLRVHEVRYLREMLELKSNI